MIIGDGDIAKVLTDKEGYIFFASGVSNSKEDRESEYEREKNLLMQQDTKKHLVYFSSLGVFTSDTRYMKHKLMMEKTVKAYFRISTIVRIGNISWGTNPNTIINHLKNMHKNGEPLDIQDTFRYVVDKDEFLYWINLIPDWDCDINITGQKLTVKEIVDKYIYENSSNISKL